MFDCKELLIKAGFSRRKAEQHAPALSTAINEQVSKKESAKDIQEIVDEYTFIDKE